MRNNQLRRCYITSKAFPDASQSSTASCLFPKIHWDRVGFGYLRRRSDSCSRWLLALMPRGLYEADDSPRCWPLPAGPAMTTTRPCRLQRMNFSFLLAWTTLYQRNRIYIVTLWSSTNVVCSRHCQLHDDKLRVVDRQIQRETATAFSTRTST